MCKLVEMYIVKLFGKLPGDTLPQLSKCFNSIIKNNSTFRTLWFGISQRDRKCSYKDGILYNHSKYHFPFAVCRDWLSSIITLLFYIYSLSIYIHRETKTGANVIMLTILITIGWHKGECNFFLILLFYFLEFLQWGQMIYSVVIQWN